jgi:hypothetical protein
MTRRDILLNDILLNDILLIAIIAAMMLFVTTWFL